MKQAIELYLQDITKVKVDVIVNAANSRLSHGGGIAKAILAAAGTDLLVESKIASFCPTGEVTQTTAGDLPANYVIHAVGPIWHGGNNDEPRLLASAYRNALSLASKLEQKSIAFPSISTGIYGYPIVLAAPIAVGALASEWELHPDIEHIRFCLFSKKDLAIYKKALQNR